ncbi:dethiobiotin synthase [Methylocystis rosea]|uniref:ATP-dependent dethiobiotin synthetase BioD n=1 Tax=Methylocystis rosea TaxID=173366 RepID=A0ABX6EH30_9HYPH|nr:dethiobiotin synthase [Methylocystis rosea]QGM93737.1 dethiobiotin synthase [Methylocystis rosea]
MVALFVTSSGTGIGKTYLTAALTRYFRDNGRKVEAYKPVISGFDSAVPEESDTGILLSAMGRPVTADEIDRISPWRFTAPLSPHIAARIEGRQIEFEALVQYSRSKATSADVVLIEGVGGIMAPLDDQHTVIDWMAQIGVPALLVVGSYLGAISHTLSALKALDVYGVEISAVIVDESPDSSVPFDDAVASIRQFAPRSKVLALRYQENRTATPPAIGDLVKLL